MDFDRPAPRLAMLAIASLLLLGSAGCSDDGSDDARTDATSTTASQATSTTAVASDITKEDLQFRPVLTATRCNDLEGRKTDTGDEVLPEIDRGETSDGTCYLVGPAGGDGTDIEAARAISDDGTWFVMVTVKESSQESINELFNSCYEGDPTCPYSGSNPGSIAIVVDGTVLSAPDVQAKDLADDAFTISVDFSEEEAGELAQVLNA